MSIKIMSIQQLHIEGFKSLRDVTWKPGALNIVIGPNASGKSNLLKALQFLSVAASGGMKEFILGLGGIKFLAWDGQAGRVGATITYPVVTGRGRTESITYDLDLRSSDTQGGFSCEKEQLTVKSTIADEEITTDLINRDPEWLSLVDEEGEVQELDADTVPSDQTVLSYFKGPLLVTGTTVNLQNGLASWSILDDVHTEQDAPMRQPAVTRHEERFSSDGQNLVAVLHTLYMGDRQFKQKLNTAMSAAFGKDYCELVFPPASSQKIELQIRWNSLQREQAASVLSDGTLRFLFLVAVLAHPNPPPLIAIDEPETGLHPRMLPIIAEYAAEASKKTQVILTTHSPQFLDAFRDVKPTTTVATWEDGQTKLATLNGDELDYWLREYTLGSLFTSGELDNMAADVREKQLQEQA